MTIYREKDRLAEVDAALRAALGAKYVGVSDPPFQVHTSGELTAAELGNVQTLVGKKLKKCEVAEVSK